MAVQDAVGTLTVTDSTFRDNGADAATAAPSTWTAAPSPRRAPR
ncbi:MAG: hypothetical protein R3F59_27305 [Myxococcota bacterium]